MEEIRIELPWACVEPGPQGEDRIFLGYNVRLIVPAEHAAGILALLSEACAGLPGAGAAVTSAKVVQTLRDLGIAGQKRLEEADQAMKGGNRG